MDNCSDNLCSPHKSVLPEKIKVKEHRLTTSYRNSSQFKFKSIKNSKLFKENNSPEPLVRVITKTMLTMDQLTSEENKLQDSIQAKQIVEFNSNKFKRKEMVNKMFGQMEYVRSLRNPIPHSMKYSILCKYSSLNDMYHCDSKSQLVHILSDLSPVWKSLLKRYLERAFLKHLFLRPLRNSSELMIHRQLLYESISNPGLLLKRFSLGNNVIKNFCKGFISFVFMFYEDLLKHKYLPIQS
jgi:hypothetical protein